MDNVDLYNLRVRAAASSLQIATVQGLLPKAPPPSLRAYFARCAIALALEHHQALATCVESRLFGSAAALARPLLEASTIGFWVMYAAPCERIKALPATPEALRLGGPDVPQLPDMLADLRGVFPPAGELLAALRGEGKARWLHQFTHGGVPQLVRRSTGWNEDHVMVTLVLADLFGIMGPCLETVIAPNPTLAEYSFARRDMVAQELFRITGEDAPAIPPPGLLAPIVDGCGPPPGR